MVTRCGGAKMAAGSGGPAARELFAEGLLQFLRPAVRQLDGHVHAVRCGACGACGAGSAAVWPAGLCGRAEGGRGGCTRLEGTAVGVA